MSSLERKTIGISVSDDLIEIVELSFDGSRKKIGFKERIILEEGIIEDGRPVKKDELSNILKEVFRKTTFVRGIF